METGEQEQGTLRPHSDTPRAQEGPEAWDKLHQSKPSVTSVPAAPGPRSGKPAGARPSAPPHLAGAWRGVRPLSELSARNCLRRHLAL